MEQYDVNRTAPDEVVQYEKMSCISRVYNVSYHIWLSPAGLM